MKRESSFDVRDYVVDRLDGIHAQSRNVLDRVRNVDVIETHRNHQINYWRSVRVTSMRMDEGMNLSLNFEHLDGAPDIDTDVVSRTCPSHMMMLDDAATERRVKGLTCASLTVLGPAQFLDVALRRSRMGVTRCDVITQ